MNTDTPRLYVACLAAYNNGHLHGRWIDASDDADVMLEEVQAMLADSPIPEAEEHAIHDYEGFPRGTVSEYTSLDEIAELVAFIAKQEEIGLIALEYCDGNISEATDMIDRYLGEYTSAEAYAEDVIGETTDIPENLAYYIDYAAIARDMELNSDIITIEKGCNEVHIFSGY